MILNSTLPENNGFELSDSNGEFGTKVLSGMSIKTTYANSSNMSYVGGKQGNKFAGSIGSDVIRSKIVFESDPDETNPTGQRGVSLGFGKYAGQFIKEVENQ